MLNRFAFEGKKNKKIKNHKFWQDGNHAIEVYSEKVTWQKFNYIHQNPVVEKFVAGEQDYLFSSARNYYGLESMLKMDCSTPQVMTVGTPVFFKVQYD